MSTADTPAGRIEPDRNPGVSFDLDWALAARASRPAVEQRAAELGRIVPADPRTEVSWLLWAIGLLDLTSLSAIDTPGSVRRLAMEARAPLPVDLIDRLYEVQATAGAIGRWTSSATASARTAVAAVCVYPGLIEPVRLALEGSEVRVCSVAAGFPAGQIDLADKLSQVRRAAGAGAHEIDVVIARALPLTGRWHALYDEVAALRQACGPACLKVILATGELSGLRQVGIAARVCLMAGADFIKTSTGMEEVNATLPAGLVMLRAVRDYRADFGHSAGIKPAGGLRSARDALAWLSVARAEMGSTWVAPGRLRLGASSLLHALRARLGWLSARL